MAPKGTLSQRVATNHSKIQRISTIPDVVPSTVPATEHLVASSVRLELFCGRKTVKRLAEGRDTAAVRQAGYIARQVQGMAKTGRSYHTQHRLRTLGRSSAPWTPHSRAKSPGALATSRSVGGGWLSRTTTPPAR